MSNLLKGICNKMSSTIAIQNSYNTYYTYNEEIRDEDVPCEVIIKKHTLPELPDEIINTILYKFGGLQHKIVPTLKMVRELTDGEDRRGSKYYFHHNCVWYGDYTYDNYDTIIQRTFDCDKYIDGKYVKYKNASVEQIFQNLGIDRRKWRRHLVSKEMSVKRLKELLDINKIYYPKSASKKKLLEAWYGFKEW
jgi:DNA-directed RNA polymerase subunit N (RpoN/RPB10)